MSGEIILKAENLVKHYPIRAGVLRRTVGHVRAVDGVSFELYKGETLGIVGESGCGKSSLGRMLMRLEEPTGGKLTFDGVDVYSQKGAAMRRLRRDIQIVFQDPYTSLNPRKTVGAIRSRSTRTPCPKAAGVVGSRSCSTWSGSTPSTSTATRTSSPAASGSASVSPEGLP